MYISQKFALIVSLLASLFLVANYYIQKEIIFPAFHDIEIQQAKKSMDRIDELLSSRINLTDRLNSDWSLWNDTYQFVQDGNDRYINNNELSDSFEGLDIDLVYFLNLESDIVWGDVNNASDVNSGKYRVSEFLSKSISLLKGHMDSIDSSAKYDKQLVKGIYNHNGEPIIFSIRPILKSNGDGPAKGFLIMGKILNDKLIKDYSNKLRTEFSIRTLDKSNTSEMPVDVNSYDIKESFNDTLSVTKVFLYNNLPVIQVRESFPREITRIGRHSIRYGLTTIFAICFFNVLMIWILVRYNIIKPLVNLTDQILSITHYRDYSLRSTIVKNDEIGILAKAFNEMLSLVENTDTQLKTVNRKLEMQSITDPLTGLPNRFNFETKLDVDWHSLRRSNQPLSILMIDIDLFKQFNDHYGHQAGDRCLKKVASILDSCMKRATDMAARFGGEEFILIMPGHNIVSAKVVAEKIQNAIAQEKMPHAGSDISDFLTISIGISSVIPSHENSVTGLIRDADTALYIAKENGKNRYEIHT